MKAKLKRYFWNLLISVDQLVNTILGGDPDETVSSRAARHSHLRHWDLLGRFLERIDPGHMKDHVELDEGKDEVFK